MRVIAENEPGDVFDELLRGARHSALHLEVQDLYLLDEEADAFGLWRDTGRIVETDADREWTGLVRETVARGVEVARLRVVDVPHRDYTRWLIATSGDNIAAGEQIRWLARDLAVGGVPVDDWWMFDNATVALLGYHDHAYTGMAVIDDQALVEVCVQAWNRLWAQAIPHADYIGSGRGRQ